MEVAVNAPKPPVSIGLAMMEPLTERGEGYYDIPALQADVGDKVLQREREVAEERRRADVGTDRIRRLRRSLLPECFLPDESGRRHP